jgi:hypothetical protein
MKMKQQVLEQTYPLRPNFSFVCRLKQFLSVTSSLILVLSSGPYNFSIKLGFRFIGSL